MGLFKRFITNQQEADMLQPIIEAEFKREKPFIPTLGKTYFYHFRPRIHSHLHEEWHQGKAINCGGLTLALMYYSDDDGSPMVRWGAAHCSRLDNFCRKIGRDIAKGRMLKKQRVKIALPENHGETLEDIISIEWREE